MINAGELDTRITFEQKVQTGVDGVGAAVFTWAPVRRVWAKRRDLRGKELLLAQEHTPTGAIEYTMRYMVGITEDMRIVDDNVPYDITHIGRIARKEGLLIQVKYPGAENG
jgi:SPP1 family predicted phage head-tail adaptor